MLVPGETESSNNIGGVKGSTNNTKKDTKKPNNIRSPFQENFPYDNIY